MERTKIGWPDHTFNPLIGCQKVSDGCKFCYAEAQMDHRYARVKWGPLGTRVRTAPRTWRKVETWNRSAWVECAECGWRGPAKDTIVTIVGNACPLCHASVNPTRQRVFCASLSDVFEDHPAWEPVRVDLLTLIEKTSNLDWLLLTKRPQNVMPLIDKAQAQGGRISDADAWFSRNRHVWIGASIENQPAVEQRLAALLAIPASVHFLSCEPLLSALDFSFDSDICHCGDSMSDHALYCGHSPIAMKSNYLVEGVDWVIAGCESGTRARPMELAWVRSIRDSCAAAKVPLFVKQLPGRPHPETNIKNFPDDLQIQQFPSVEYAKATDMASQICEI